MVSERWNFKRCIAKYNRLPGGYFKRSDLIRMYCSVLSESVLKALKRDGCFNDVVVHTACMKKKSLILNRVTLSLTFTVNVGVGLR